MVVRGSVHVQRAPRVAPLVVATEVARAVAVDAPDRGTVEVAVVYGGLWYAVVPTERVGLTIEPANVARLVALSHVIRGALNADLGVLPDDPERPTRVPQLLWTGPAVAADAHGRNMATSSELGFDRSPCGTGSSARMALEHVRGRLGELPARAGVPPIGQAPALRRPRVRVLAGGEPGRVRHLRRRGVRATLLAQTDDPLAGGFHIPPASG